MKNEIQLLYQLDRETEIIIEFLTLMGPVEEEGDGGSTDRLEGKDPPCKLKRGGKCKKS